MCEGDGGVLVMARRTSARSGRKSWCRRCSRPSEEAVEEEDEDAGAQVEEKPRMKCEALKV